VHEEERCRKKGKKYSKKYKKKQTKRKRRISKRKGGHGKGIYRVTSQQIKDSSLLSCDAVSLNR
jgi:hypothetical protein